MLANPADSQVARTARCTGLESLGPLPAFVRPALGRFRRRPKRDRRPERGRARPLASSIPAIRTRRSGIRASQAATTISPSSYRGQGCLSGAYGPTACPRDGAAPASPEPRAKRGDVEWAGAVNSRAHAGFFGQGRSPAASRCRARLRVSRARDVTPTDRELSRRQPARQPAVTPVMTDVETGKSVRNRSARSGWGNSDAQTGCQCRGDDASVVAGAEEGLVGVALVCSAAARGRGRPARRLNR